MDRNDSVAIPSKFGSGMEVQQEPISEFSRTPSRLMVKAERLPLSIDTATGLFEQMRNIGQPITTWCGAFPIGCWSVFSGVGLCTCTASTELEIHRDRVA